MLQNPHHQPTSSSISQSGIGGSSTFDHPRLSGSRDDQKRLALDECTNYLQQKTMQQHFPSTSIAISNIINSNRSASSAGVPQNPASQSSTNAAAKKFQAFKFNLTMNKNKAAQNQAESGPSYSSNAFYQAQMMTNDHNTLNEQEDDDAMVINDKHKKQVSNLSRGSSQLAMKQHLKQMIKSYEDQPQLQGTNLASDGTQRFDYAETQQLTNDQQQHLTYDNAMRHAAAGTLQPPPSTSVKFGPPGSASSSSKSKPLDKKVHEMEERQKIFEEEIIKRVKEIQSYAKTLHMHLKKIQQSSNKKSEDMQIMKEELTLAMKECQTSVVSKSQGSISEQLVHDMVEKRLKILDSEVALQIEHLEQKQIKDFDTKLQRQQRNSQNDLQLRSDSLKEELLGFISQDFTLNLKQEIARLVSDKIKESSKLQDKTINDIRDLVLEKAQQIEDVSQSLQSVHRESTARSDKLSKSLKEHQSSTDESISALGQQIREEMEMMRKRMISEIKSEQQGKHFVSQESLSEQLEEFEQRISSIQMQIREQGERKGHVDQHFVEAKVDQMQMALEEQIGQVANELTQFQDQQAQKDEQIKSIQEAYLQLKSHQASASYAFEENISNFHAKLQNNEKSISTLKDEINEVREAIQNQDARGDNTDMVTEQVMDQVQPEIDNLNEVSKQICEQLETVKMQLSQKCLQSDLQEVKQDIEDELKSHEKLIKNQNALSENLKIKIDSQDAKIDNHQHELKNSITLNENKVAQQFSDLYQKTEDLYDEIKEIQEQLQSVTNVQPRQESTPERKSRLEAIASLKVTLEAQIAEANQRITELESQSADEGASKQIEELKLSIGKTIQEVEQKISKASKQDIEMLKTQIEEQYDDTISTLNRHDQRISSLEEKIFDQQSALKEDPVVPQDNTNSELAEQFENLQNQFYDLKSGFEHQSTSQIALSKDLSILKSSLAHLTSDLEVQASSHAQSLDTLTSDLQTQRELNACLQDVVLTKEEFEQYKNSVPESNSEIALHELRKENERMDKEIQALREMVTTVSEKIMESMDKKFREWRPLQSRPNQESYRTSQPNGGENFLSSPPQMENQSPSPNGRLNQEQTKNHNQINFLDELSEVISSPNNFGNQTADGEMMMYNNRSQNSNSVERNSILSNNLGNLISPIGDRQFHFNSQIAGQRLNIEKVKNTVEEPEVVSSILQDKLETPQEERKINENSVQATVKHETSEEHKQQESPRSDDFGEAFETESPQKEQDDDIDQPEESSEDAAPLQEINISLESAREEEEPTNELQRQLSTPSTAGRRITNHHQPSGGPDRKSPAHQEPEVKAEEEVFDEEERKSEDDNLSNQNVEEVLQDLMDAADDEELMFQRISDGDQLSQGEESKDGQTPAQAVEDEDGDQGVHLLSPTAVNPVNQAAAQLHHPTVHNQHLHQAHHFVAFESDEEDSQQYDLVPITNSRNAQGPHGAPQPAPVIGNVQNNNRNRYYESGSGEDEALANNQDDAQNQNDEGQLDEIDDFHVEFQESEHRRRSIPDAIQPDGQVEEGEEAKNEDFDDSPFDAASSQRFDQRFEDEGNMRRPITSLPRNLREQDNNDDPEFQAIQHETLSSHHSSEVSGAGFNSRRSASPNLDHSNGNIDSNEEEVQADLLEDAQEIENPDAVQQISHLEGFPNEESKIDPNQIQEDSVEPLSQRDNKPDEADDWNLEDVTVSQRLDDQLFDQEEENKEDFSQDEDSEMRSEVVANWIVERELNLCLNAVMMLKNRWTQSSSDDLNIEESAEW